MMDPLNEMKTVIAVDPRSKTSPKHILDRWESYMTIVRWNDKKFMSKRWLPENREQLHDGDTTAKFVLHRERQRHFYPTCLAALRAVNRTWTTVIDIDEYATINQNYAFRNETKKQTQEQQTTLLEVIKTPTHHYDYTDSACITMPRLRFGSHDNANKPDDATLDDTTLGRNQVETIHLPKIGNHVFQESDFMTLRWHYRANLHSKKDNRNPKSMVDVSAIKTQFSRQDTDAHRPVRSVCPKRNMYIQNKDSPFVVHHYTGTFEQYNFRNDARAGLKQRNPKRYKEYQNIHDAYDDTICGWIQSFVAAYGAEQANIWLAGVGNVSYAPPS